MQGTGRRVAQRGERERERKRERKRERERERSFFYIFDESE